MVQIYLTLTLFTCPFDFTKSHDSDTIARPSANARAWKNEMNTDKALACSLPFQNVKDLEASVVFTGDNESDDWDDDTKEQEDNHGVDEKVVDSEAVQDKDGFSPFSASASTEVSDTYRQVIEEFDGDAEIAISGIASSSRIHWVLEKDKRTSVHLYR